MSLSYSQPESPILGDLNQDDRIDVIDILRSINIILEIPPLPNDDEIISGDLNVDESIDVLDILIIVDIITNDLDEYCTNDNFDIPCETNYSECCYPFTSHEIEWEASENLGIGSFTVRDIEIIDENNIYVVGGFSTVEEPTDISQGGNVGHWNGVEWTYFSVPTPLIQFEEPWEDSILVHPLYTINQIEVDIYGNLWLATFNNALTKWDGEEATFYYNYDYTFPIDHVGFSGAGISDAKSMEYYPPDYLVIGGQATVYYPCEEHHCEGGSISIFRGDSLKSAPEFPSNGQPHTDVYSIVIDDIEEFYFTLAINSYYSRIMKYDHGEYTTIYEDIAIAPNENELSGYIKSMWGYEDTLYIPGEIGMYKLSKSTGEGSWTNLGNDMYNFYDSYTFGTHPNNIFFTRGYIWEYYSLWHFNGLNWHYESNFNNNFFTNIQGAQIKGSTIGFVGSFLNSLSPILIKGTQR